MPIGYSILFWLLVMAFLAGICFGFAIRSFFANWQLRRAKKEEEIFDFNDIRKRGIKNILRTIKGGKEKDK